MKLLPLMAAIVFAFARDANAMPPTSPQPAEPSDGLKTMLELGFVLLNKPEQAIDLVQTLVRIRFGQAEVDEEGPYVAEDAGDAWKVTGTNFGSHALPFFPSRCVVVVRKSNGEVLDFTHEAQGPDGRPLRAPMPDGSSTR